MSDVAASMGVIVCRIPPRPHVIAYAKKKRIDFCTVFDIDDCNWASTLLIPVILTFVGGVMTPHLTISRKVHSSPVRYESGRTQFRLSNDNGGSSVDLLEFATKLVTDKKITTSGEHKIQIEDDTMSIDVGDCWLPLPKMRIDFVLTVERKYSYCQPDEYSALRNHSSGTLSIAKLKLCVPSLYAAEWEDVKFFEPSLNVQAGDLPIVDLSLSELAESGGIGFQVSVEE